MRLPSFFLIATVIMGALHAYIGVRVLPDLPKTPTNKVRKVDFRNDGVTPDAWDREKAGIVLKGVKLK